MAMDRKWWRRSAVLAGLATALASPALAQGMLPPVRIGVVLPAVADGATEIDLAVARAAEQGAVIAEEEFAFNAEMLGIQMAIPRQAAATPEEAVAAAEQMVADGAFAIIGGYSTEQAIALGAWAAERGIPFVNVGSTSDAIRNGMCMATTFHVEPSAAMYLDAMAGWYVRAGFRNWFIVEAASDEGAALHQRLSWSLTNRHFGAREVGTAMHTAGSGGGALVQAIQRAGADLVVLLIEGEDQLDVLGDLDAAGLQIEVAAFPYPDTQTRTFFLESREIAPRLGVQHRATSWEATLDAYGAREMNARYRLRFNEPMDGTAWATYQAVKILYEAAFFSGSLDPGPVLAYLTAPQSVFDVYKGIGTSFRPWDRQLRQSLYLDKISETEANTFAMVLLVGELPAIYMAGTDPVERLDQLGDLANRSSCRQ